MDLLFLQDKISKMEARLAQSDVDIDGMRQTTRANRHFNEVVVPHFKTQFESYGKTDGERIDNIECKIHELLLEDIKKTIILQKK